MSAVWINDPTAIRPEIIAARRLEAIEAWGRRSFFVALTSMLILAAMAGGVLYMVADYVKAKQAVAQAVQEMQAQLPKRKAQIPF